MPSPTTAPAGAWRPPTVGSPDRRPVKAGSVPLAGAVLVGGEGRRLGGDKPLVEIDGVPMAARVARALREAGADPVVLVGGDDALGARLHLPTVPDRWPGAGPLGGIATALAAHQGPGLVAVAACDQPDLDPGLIGTLAEALVTTLGERMAAAPVTPDGRRHPFPSVWRPAARGLVAGLVDLGARRAGAAFSPGLVVDVPVGPEAVADVDTPEDLDRRRGRAGGAP